MRKITNTSLRVGFVLLATLTSVALTAIFTDYKGVVDIRIKHGSTSGEIVIDGRSDAHPSSLPPDQM